MRFFSYSARGASRLLERVGIYHPEARTAERPAPAVQEEARRPAPETDGNADRRSTDSGTSSDRAQQDDSRDQRREPPTEPEEMAIAPAGNLPPIWTYPNAHLDGFPKFMADRATAERFRQTFSLYFGEVQGPPSAGWLGLYPGR